MVAWPGESATNVLRWKEIHKKDIQFTIDIISNIYLN